MYPATYTDGSSAVRRSVRVSVARNSLYISDESGQAVDEWPIPGLRFPRDLLRGGEPFRLSHREKGDARLFFPSQEILETLTFRAPALGPRRSRGRKILFRAGVALVTLGGLAGILLAALPYGADRLARHFPPKWEKALGARLMIGLVKRYPPCTGSDGSAALASLARRIAGNRADLRNVRIHVLQSPVPNAFALPGGYIGFFEGMIQFARSPEELAGVLAHEMAHEMHRHPLKSILQQSGYRILFHFMWGDNRFLGSSAAQIAGRILFLSFSRAAERESDQTSIDMLNRAGIRSDGLPRLLSRLQKTAPAGSVGRAYFSTHPPPGERAQLIRERTREGKAPMTADEWKAVRRICRIKGKKPGGK